VLKTLALRDGLTAITERIRYARKLAARARQPLAWTHFVETHLSIQADKTPAATGWK